MGIRNQKELSGFPKFTQCIQWTLQDFIPLSWFAFTTLHPNFSSLSSIFLLCQDLILFQAPTLSEAHAISALHFFTPSIVHTGHRTCTGTVPASTNRNIHKTQSPSSTSVQSRRKDREMCSDYVSSEVSA